MLGVSHLTALDAAPRDFVLEASQAGFDRVGLRIVPATHAPDCYRIVGDRQLIRDLRSIADSEGISITEGESFAVEETTDVKKFLPGLEVAAELGVRYIVSGGAIADKALLAARYAELAEHCEQFGIGLGIEFMPIRPMASLDDALAVLGMVGHSNAKLLIDCLHLFRSGGTVAGMAAVAPDKIGYIHLCDAPLGHPGSEGLLLECLESRLYPGDGGLPLKELFKGFSNDVYISLEAPNASDRKLSTKERLVKAGKASRRFMESLT